MILDERSDPCKNCICLENRLAPVQRRDTIASPIAIVVDAPTALEQSKKKLLQGDSGVIVKKVLEAYGVNVDDCYVTTALNCRPNMKKPAMVKRSMLSCKKRLVQEIVESGATKVLCLGAVGLSQLLDSDKVLPITKVRGRWERVHDLDVLGTFAPGWLFGEKDYFRDFAADLKKFATTDPDPPPDLEMWYPQTVKEMWDAFKEMSGASFISCDVETLGLKVICDELLAVGFAVMYDGSHDGLAVVLRQDILEADDTWECIGHYLSNPHLASVFHNAKFDLKFLRRDLLERELPYDPQNIQDTMMLNYCLDERPMGRFASHSLKNIARTRCDAPDYDINMGKWIKEYKDPKTTDEKRATMRAAMHEYLALDCYYTARIYPELVNEVMEEDPQLMDHYQNLLMPGTLALTEIEQYGATVDRPFFEMQWENLQERAEPVLERIHFYTENEEFNPNSPQQVAKYLYEDLGLPILRTARRGKQQEGKTAKAVLKMLRKVHPEHRPLIDDILEYRNLIKNAGTYVKGILTRMDEDDRIRCDLLLHGTSTGRLSSQNPNLQNIPEASHTKIEIRNGYVAPPGYLMGNADYSQLELRVAAWLSGDEAFRAVYLEGRDLHQEVAFAFFQKPKEEITAYERYMAKCMNFGVVYGRGPGSLAHGPEMEYIVDELGGNRWTEEDLKEFFEKFFETFPQFKAWMDKQYQLGYTQQWVNTPFGNRRRFPFIPRGDAGITGRAAMNSPIQGTAALITFSSVLRIHNRFKELNAREGRVVAHVILTVHDSIMFDFLPEYLEEVRSIVLWEMEENIPLPIDVPLKADMDIGPRWGGIKDWNEVENMPAVLEGTYYDD